MRLKSPSENINGGYSIPELIFSKRISGFFFVGIISSLADIGILYFLTEDLGIWYMESAGISYCCGILISYGLNKHLTFQDRSRKYFRQFLIFASVSVSSLILTLCIIWVFVELLHQNYLTGKIFAIIAAFFWNFTGQSRLTFRRCRE